MRSIIILLIFPFFSICLAQIPDSKSQLKISYTMKYEKVPFQMKLFKKYLPTEMVEYNSRLGSRSEVNINAKVLGKKIINSTIAVNNDSLAISWVKTTTIVNDSIVDNQLIENKYTTLKQDVFIGDKSKNILGYDCVSFVSEDDSVKTEGFLAPAIIVAGDFQQYGLPLEFKTSSKTEKLVVTTKANEIIMQPLNTSIFLFTQD